MNKLTISNLLYEEVIMLQEILLMIDATDFTSNLDSDELKIFNSLYEKVMSS